MDQRERCVFLNEEGLCDMILNIGEENICSICREHPRFYEQFSFGEEVGVGLCCEAAAKLILEGKYSDELESSEGSRESDSAVCEMEKEELLIENALMRVRKVLLDHTEAFESLWLGEKENEITFSGKDTSETEGARAFAAEFTKAFYQVETLTDLADLLLDLEIAAPEWDCMLKELRENTSSLLEYKEEFLGSHPETGDQYKRLMRYFIYRYYMMARYDEDVETGAQDKLNFAMLSVGIILMMDLLKAKKSGRFTLEDQINICKLYSQEIEYDEDNVLALEGFWIL